MKPILITINKDRTGFHSPSEFTRMRLRDMMKKYTWFAVTPMIRESKKMRGYLEGAVIPEYVKFQYNLNPRDPQTRDTQRFLFKRDFNSEIIKDRSGNPQKVPKTTTGHAKELLDAFTSWAEQNGCPIPNPELYKLWRDQWSMDMRFDCFHSFLKFLDIECDAMPSNQTLAKLKEENG